ncbi:MAG: hypothetical protein FWD78_11180 [Treponema sp.]|nr:hypothetical protein [Treponema sp.]
MPVVKSPVTLTLGLPVNVNVSDYYDNDLTRYLEKLTGIKINFILYDTGNDGNVKLQLQVAGGDKLPDIIKQLGIETNQVRQSYGEAGVIIPLNDYIDKVGVFTKKAVDQTAIAQNGINPWLYGTDDNGKIWGYMQYYTIFTNQYGARAWYNEDFAKKLGMSSADWTGGGTKGKIPTQDWFYKYLIGVRDNDVNGNGDKNDEIPLTGGTGYRMQLLDWLTLQYFYNDYASTGNYWLIKNNQLIYNYDLPEYRDALRFINKLYKEKLFEDVAITQNAASLTATVITKPYKVGITVSAGLSVYDDDSRLVYKPIPIVEGPSGFSTTVFFQQVPTFPWAISSSCANPEAAFRWLDAQASDPDFTLYTRYGVLGRDWRLIQQGETRLYGDRFKPYFVPLILTWGSMMTNAHWQNQFGIDYLDRSSALAWNGNASDAEYLQGQAMIGMFPFKPAQYPEAVIFTSAETQQWADTRTNIRNYVEQCLAQFATGQLDIEKDWDTYIKNLKTLGSDQLLAVDQAAYARMKSIGK